MKYPRFSLTVLAILLGYMPSFTEAQDPQADLSPAATKDAGSTPQIVFQESFKEEHRGDFQIQGDVAWRNGVLQLNPEAGIFRNVNVGDWVQVELTCDWNEIELRGSDPVLQVMFSPANTTPCMLNLRALNAKTERRFEATVADIEVDDGETQTPPIRTAEIQVTTSTPLVIEYRHGLISLYQGEERLLVGALDKGTGDIETIGIAVGSTSWSLRELSVAGNASQPPTTPEQDKELADLWNKSEQLETLYAEGKLREMVDIAESVYEGYQRVLGERHPLTVNSLNSVAFISLQLGDLNRAEELFTKVRAIYRELLGPWHLDYSVSTNNLAALCIRKAEYRRALPMLEETIRIRETVQGEDHLDLAINLNNLAYLLHQLGDVERAIPMFTRAAAIEEQAYGRRHRDVAVTLNNLANAYEDGGDAVRAEKLLLEVIDIEKQLMGPDNPARAATLSSLAVLYQFGFGDLARASELHLEAKQIRENALGKQHPDYAQSLSNLSSLFQTTGDYERAEELLRESLAIREATLGKDHPEYAWTIRNLSALYFKQGEYDKSETLAREVLKIRQKSLGEDHWDTADSHRGIGEILLARGNVLQAREQFTKGWTIMKSRLGSRHPKTAPYLSSIARTHLSEGSLDEAEVLLQEGFDAHIEQARLLLPALSEAQALNWVRNRRLPINLLFEVLRLRRAASAQPSTAERSYEYLWSDKALLRRIRVTQHQPPSTDKEAYKLFNTLRDTRLELARLAAATPPKGKRDAFQKRLTDVSNEKEQLEKQLAGLMPMSERDLRVRDARVEDLLGVLPPGVAVIDTALMVDTNRLRQEMPVPNSRESQARVYEAFVLRSDGHGDQKQVQWVHVGPADPVDQAISRYRQQIQQIGKLDSRPTDVDNEVRPDQILRELLWDRFEPALQGCHTVIVIPDGQLGRLPWAALPGRQPNSYLIEDYAIGTASFGQQLFALLTDQKVTSEGELLVLGGVEYDQREESPDRSQAASLDLASRRGSSIEEESERTWPYLPGAEREADEILDVWGERGDATWLKGPFAIESTVANHLSRSRYVHLATHGFFDQSAETEVRDLVVANLAAGTGDLGPGSQVTARNPLLLSGIVVAGANLGPRLNEMSLPMGEDGILTAEELVGLDLTKSELVTLSACETGLGKIASGEGVFGLSRALHQAGARSVVSSLWKVDDQATRVLMTEFYRNLWVRGLGKLQALRAAQLKMLHEYVPAPGTARGIVNRPIVSASPEPQEKRLVPFYWSAFQLSGDWR